MSAVTERKPGMRFPQPVTTSGASARLPISLGWSVILSGAYVFVLNSRASEILGLHNLKVAAILMLLALIGAGLSFVQGRTAFGSIATAYMILTGLFTVSTVFSVWRGGSVEVFIDQWVRSVALFIAVAFTATNLREALFVVKAAATGFLFLGLYVLAVGPGVAGDRIGGATSTGDPNFLALAMLYAIPLCLFFVERRKVPVKILALSAIAVMLAVLALSGSRGGLIGLGAVLLVWFLTTSARVRVLLVLVGIVGIAAGFLLLPDSIVERYQTITGGAEAAAAGQDAAVESRKARTYLFIRSLELTIQNPIFGVGLGMFSVAEDDLAKSRGARKGAWHVTHNMYTEVSSENGIPAAVVYIAILVLAFRKLNACVRAGKQSANLEFQELARLAYWLRLSIIGVMSAGMFLSIAYAGYIPVLAALATVLHRRASEQAPVAAPATAARGYAPPVTSRPR